jgi:flagellar basal-body rod protein FlgB
MEMLGKLYSLQNYVISNKLLDKAHLNHELLSHNLANIETPGYKRSMVEPTFDAKLEALVDAKKVQQIKGMKPAAKIDYDTKPVRVDGNNVELDKELLLINQNALNYEFLTQSVSSTIKHLNKAIKGQI